MNKPHFSAEPSMEDILTSIRKMISEERLGPRPVPDQIGRAPFGDTREPVVRSSNPEPLPERGPAVRSGPSFSSLSDALKAAAPGSAQRRTLEEKIADMLEDGSGPNGESAAPADSLAVFDANRPQPASPMASAAPGRDTGMLPSSRPAAPAPADDQVNARQSPSMETPSHRMRPVPGASRVPMNGSASHREPKPADPAGLRPDERPPARRMPPPARSNGAPAPKDMRGASPKAALPRDVAAKDATKDTVPKDTAPKAGPAGADPTIIAMPSRLPSAAPGAGTPGPSPAGPAMNGATVSPLGSRPVPEGPQPARPAMREADKVMAKVAEKVSDKIASRGPDAVPQGATKADAPSAPPRAEAPRSETRPERQTSGPFGAGPDVSENTSQAFVAKAAEGSSMQPDAAKTSSARAPSEALIDAVVDLVHKEPDSLSVFTSGSAFIHGVTGDEPHSDKPTVSPRKLDRSAAELLRPMLRQWLADNMPRIVEEALRSELMSGQGTDSEET